MKDILPIAFYLPQFHAIPENDSSYGTGFTEWTNVKKATPLFEGHYQPRVPLNKEYYCLLDPGIMKKQAELAKEYGVYGFCYYHYWFSGGKKLLEKPVEKMLDDKSINIPFCLCWANENWTRRWDGGNDEIIVEQDYGNLDDIKNHAIYFSRYFSDERYMKIDGRPILLVYKPDLIPNCKSYIEMLRSEIRKTGFDALIVFQFPNAIVFGNYLKLCDYYIEFEPTYVQKIEIKESRNVLQNLAHDTWESDYMAIIRHNVKRKKKIQTLQMFDYDTAWEKILNHKVLSEKAIAGAFVDWDNTPRKSNGIVYKGATPKKFGNYFSRLIEKVDTEYKTPYIFVNAWNEWGEGAYLEPDEKYGHQYLEELKRALDKNKR